MRVRIPYITEDMDVFFWNLNDNEFAFGFDGNMFVFDFKDENTALMFRLKFL